MLKILKRMLKIYYLRYLRNKALGRRSPLLQWHMEHNVVPSHAGLGILVAPSRAPPRAAGPSALATESAHRKCLELKRALYEIVPAFFALVREASRRDPKVAWRIYGRLARAGTAFVDDEIPMHG